MLVFELTDLVILLHIVIVKALAEIIVPCQIFREEHVGTEIKDGALVDLVVFILSDLFG